jgi:hypothetical protein
MRRQSASTNGRTEIVTFESQALAEVPSSRLEPVRYWNDVLLQVFRRAGGAPGPLARTAAMVHGAIFDVVNNQDRVDRRLRSPRYLSYLGRLPTRRGASVEDAINVAARDILLALHPNLAADINAAFAARYPGNPSRIDSPLGRAAARAMLRARANDGADDDMPYIPDGVPGAWRPTTPGTSAATPNWGRVTPFALTAGSMFRPPLPAGSTSYAGLLASPVYAQQVNEVKALGEAGASRTQDQTHSALFWANDLDGTYKPPGHLLNMTAEIVPPQQLLDDARLFALMSFALADATITAWDSKYDTPIDLWRPETAIRLADTDGNDGTTPQPDWQPLSATAAGAHFSPPFPAYISGHATLAGAWAEILRRYVGADSRRFTVTSEDPNLPAGSNTRTFSSFSQAAIEDARSRIYLGVHFQFDADQGVEAGTAVGAHTFRTQFYPLEGD